MSSGRWSRREVTQWGGPQKLHPQHNQDQGDRGRLRPTFTLHEDVGDRRGPATSQPGKGKGRGRGAQTTLSLCFALQLPGEGSGVGRAALERVPGCWILWCAALPACLAEVCLGIRCSSCCLDGFVDPAECQPQGLSPAQHLVIFQSGWQRVVPGG